MEKPSGVLKTGTGTEEKPLNLPFLWNGLGLDGCESEAAADVDRDDDMSENSFRNCAPWNDISKLNSTQPNTGKELAGALNRK